MDEFQKIYDVTGAIILGMSSEFPYSAIGGLIGSALGTFIAPIILGRQRRIEKRNDVRLEAVRGLTILTGELEAALHENPNYRLQSTWSSRFFSACAQLRALMPGNDTELALDTLGKVIFETGSSDR